MPPSQPMPTAPGPNWAQRSSSTWAMCSSAKRVRPSGSGVRRNSIHETCPPCSHVASTLCGASQRSIVPDALPSNEKRPPGRRSPEIGRNQREIRSGSVHASHTSSGGVSYTRAIVIVRASPASSVRLPTRRSTLLIWCSTSIMGCSSRRWCPGAGAAAPRAISVASASRCGVQNARKWSTRRRRRAAARVDGVQPAGALGTDRGEAGLAEDTQVLGDRRLRDAELVPDRLGDRADDRSPAASSSRIRLRTGSPRTSNACTPRSYQGRLI